MSFSSKARTFRRVVGGIALAAALVACGGGTSQYDPFDPGRLIVFGDENSLLDAQGHRWSINYIDKKGDGTADDVFDCTGNGIWVQRLASHYGLVFAECNPDEKDVKAFFRSTVGARVDDIAAQIAVQQDAGGGFRDDDLTTVMVGANDILALYADYPTRSATELKSAAERLGERLAAQVKVLVDRGSRVLLSTVPDMGLTPFARAEQAAKGGDRTGLLTDLTSAFNEGLVTGLAKQELIDGRYLGLVDADTRVKLMHKSPGSFGMQEEDAAACLATAVLPDCNSLTLVEDASNTDHLWADATHLGPRAHADLADRAITRAEDNPF